jgi:predicted signal transduction protein with EAL and GGDEF domain
MTVEHWANLKADFLNARGSVIHQGYLYARPEPVEKWQQRLNVEGSNHA